jgi:eukaryotic-like serine/threonine-protein kinase
MATPVPVERASQARSRASRHGGVEERYQPIFLLGRGGMGTVEVALERGVAGFERVVALKRLLPEQAREPRHKEMFLREARLAALLKHPNVVHAYAFGELYGELFIAMEYVEGEPLSRVLTAVRESNRPTLDPALVAFVLAEVCDGLHAAHELRDAGGRPLSVVHRDVSPQNVMMAYDGRVKILDFGVAKLDAGSHETRTGEVKGKMAYMSPEQALGEKLDRRSDLYSIGAVLFECLTGRRMWGTGTDLDVMRRLALEDPPSLQDAMHDAPPALVKLHARLVARDPAGRPATAKDAADELRRYASSWPAPDATAAAALMFGLFGPQAQERQTRLTKALQETAPLRVESLRKTLDPERSFAGTRTEPLILQSERPPAPAQRKTRRGGLLVGSALLVVAAAVTAGMIRKSPSGWTASATAAPGLTPPPALDPPPSLTLAPPPALAPTPTLSPSLAPASAPAPTPARSLPNTQPTKRPPARGAATATASARARPPDVDPTPF